MEITSVASTSVTVGHDARRNFGKGRASLKAVAEGV
jgi:hypothetical protein